MRFRDPVCGMEIRWEEAVDYAVVGPLVVYFCCPGCARRFRQDPARHVAVEEWLSDAPPPPGGSGCARDPRSLAGGDGQSHRSLRAGAVPAVAGVTLDELEALVVRRWQRILGTHERETMRSRVLERALLLRAITDEDLEREHQLDRMVAAEVARLRSLELERERIASELEALPDAYVAALRDVTPCEADVAGLAAALRGAVSDVRGWIARPAARQTASSGR